MNAGNQVASWPASPARRRPSKATTLLASPRVRTDQGGGGVGPGAPGGPGLGWLMIVALAGGVGAARLLCGLVAVADPASVMAVVNTGDDTVLHGLHISPDLDTVTYTLAGVINPDTGWGLSGETWAAMEGFAPTAAGDSAGSTSAIATSARTCIAPRAWRRVPPSPR